MATKSFLTCLNLQILRQKIFIAIYTTPCANMSVSVYPVSSFREEMRFVILHHKCSEFYWNEQLFSLQFIHNAKVQKQDIPTTFGGVGMSCLFQTFTTSRKPLTEWNLSLFHNHHYRIASSAKPSSGANAPMRIVFFISIIIYFSLYSLCHVGEFN